MDPVTPDVAARFKALLEGKRSMLLALARQAAANVQGARDRGHAITEDLLAQEEYALRLEAAAEALGSSELPMRGGEVKPRKPRRSAHG